MKIIYISFESPKDVTGVGRKIKAQMKYWEQEGHQARHIQLRYQDDNEVIKKYTSNHTLNLALNLKNIKDALREEKPDIIYMREVLYVPFLINALEGIPYCIEINSDAKAEYKNQSWAKYTYYTATHKFLKSNAAGIVSVSKELLAKAEIGENAKHLILANGYDFEQVKQMAPVPDSETLSLIFVGSATQPWSGVENIEILAKACPQFNFHLVGGGFKSNLPNIITYDYLNAESLKALYSVCDIGIGTFGLYKKGMDEASPLKIREYIAYGLPVILPFIDTDLSRLNTEHGVLTVPNAPLKNQETLTQIKKFCLQWKGQRLNVGVLKQILSYDSKEKKRLNFFEEILESLK